MNTQTDAFDTAFDALLDADTKEDAAPALAALRDATDGPDEMRLALYDAFGDTDHALLDGVAFIAATDPAFAAAVLFFNA